MIIVTGASGGIGRALLPLLADDDHVIGLYNRTAPPAAEAAGKVEHAKLDLSSEAAIAAFAEGLKDRPGNLTVVHCAAKSIDKLAVHCEPADWDDVFDVNLRGDFLLSKALVPMMIRRKWGRIIHVSSVVGAQGAPGTVAYAASKTGLTGLSRVLAKEYGRFGITSNVLCLGYFEAGLIETLPEERRSEILGRIPARRFGAVAEIASAIRWLVQSGYVNGAVVNIDGGI